VPAGVVRQHRAGSPADVVDVLHLPGGVVQEVPRSLLHEDVVVAGGTST
jgi:hypothetical protein